MKTLIILLAAGIILTAGAFTFFRSPEAPPENIPTSVEDEVVGGDRDEHGCIGSAGYTWCPQLDKCLRVWEEPCISGSIDTAVITGEISQALIAKHGQSAGNLEVTVTRVDGDYAQGGARPATGDAGGGMWFAAKTETGWNLVWDGNGIIRCQDLTDYPEFPEDMIPECFDDQTGSMVTRQ